ncbi:MAG: GspE/PulE family protein, partial [Candidatus Binatia bacterium]
HLVLSTLHTNNAAETITRLLEMGMEPFSFADSLLCVLGQRLVRTICPKCREPYQPDQAEVDALVGGYGEQEFAALGIGGNGAFPPLSRGGGCEDCNGTGYRGRMGIHELLVASDAIKKLVRTRASVDELKRVATAEGMTTLLQDGILKILSGATDHKQVWSVAMR